ncbi:SDR family NAD(P)-dependent oxidoreductase, partial [Xanthomonas sp. Kuri4-2]
MTWGSRGPSAPTGASPCRPSPPIVLITGGSRGLGRNAALHLARQGADLILTYRGHREAALSAVAEI